MTDISSLSPDDDPNAALAAMVPPPGQERTRAFSVLLRALTDDGSAGRGGR